MEVVGVAHDGESGVKMCAELRPDVILMDINMPVMDGVTATGKIRDILPDAKILILTVHADDVHVFQGIKAGATGYLLKDCTPEDLSISEKTVRNHVSNIYKKLHVYDRTQAVLYAIREGLIETEGLEER